MPHYPYLSDSRSSTTQQTRVARDVLHSDASSYSIQYCTQSPSSTRTCMCNSCAERGRGERARAASVGGGGGRGGRRGRRRDARAAQGVHRDAGLPGEHGRGLLAHGVAGALARHRHEHQGGRARQGVSLRVRLRVRARLPSPTGTGARCSALSTLSRAHSFPRCTLTASPSFLSYPTSTDSYTQLLNRLRSFTALCFGNLPVLLALPL